MAFPAHFRKLARNESAAQRGDGVLGGVTLYVAQFPARSIPAVFGMRMTWLGATRGVTPPSGPITTSAYSRGEAQETKEHFPTAEDQTVTFRSQLHYFGAPTYRSHSPITKSSEPRMLTTSLSMWPGRIFGRMLRLMNEGLRIFRRYGVPPPLL